MTRLETNIFLITNLSELKCEYRLYAIRGLSTEQDEYNRNVQILIRDLSYRLRSPVTVIVRDSKPHLVLRTDAAEPPSPFQLVRTTAYFERTDEVLTLDYQNRTAETGRIGERFLQFAVQGALGFDRELWQPVRGKPFFLRQPVFRENGVEVYRGFAVRIVPPGDGAMGVCVDVKHRYVSECPLPARLSKSEFRKHRGANCVYHWGSSWYDIKLREHSGLTAGEYMINGQSLLDYTAKNVTKPLPREVAELSGDTAAIVYLTPTGDARAASAALCYPVFETGDPRIQRLHRKSILGPRVRRCLIHDFVENHLAKMQFKDVPIEVSSEPLRIQRKIFLPPDLAFGHNTVVSVRGTEGAVHVGLEGLGRLRLSALFDTSIGPYTRRPLDRQYLIWPQSVADSFGPVFLEELTRVVNGLYPQVVPYDPVLIAYNDRVPRTFSTQGRAILEAVDSAVREPGYGIVMIHETPAGGSREEDQLAAMAMRELRKRDLFVSVIHTTVPRDACVLVPNGPGPAKYKVTSDPRASGRFNGYLRNVAITKVLLTNEKWPFVLSTPLHADLTICIDVKHHTACLAFVGKCGPDIRTICEESNQKESLGRRKVKAILDGVLRSEWELGRKCIRSIVVQRDGRLSIPEKRGIEEAVEGLKQDDVLRQDTSLDLVEISKTSPAPLRIFDVSRKPNDGEYVDSPQVGSYYVLSERDGYVCSTGKAFPRPGTANPLHVSHVGGGMPFEHLLEDVFALTCLTWTRPEDCTRYPITVKLTDMRLREHAGDYEADELRYGDEPAEEGEDE